MAKWKCGICNSEFDNFQAQGFDGIIYCPLCYFKKLNNDKDKEIERLNNIIDKKNIEITILKNKLDMIKNNVDDLIKRKDKQSILDIIEIYTGFWGKGDDNE